MRIAITADPYLPVPPPLYGGIERVVQTVIDGLVGQHHQVTLFAHPESTVPCALVPYGAPPHTGLRRQLELAALGGALWRRRDQFDLVLSWGRLAALLPILPVRRLPKIQFYCRDSVPWRSVTIAAGLAGPSLLFSGSSDSVYDARPGHPGAGTWETLYYATDVSRYTFVPAVPDDAPLVFLGRIERIKGAHTAIAIARASGRRLIIAGNRVGGEGETYFEQEVRPHLDDRDITYIGPVDDRQKNELLGSAAALVFPIEWREAFGIVMAESLACGTPIIGYAWGSVPEVVREGVTGFVCRDVAQAVRAVHMLPTLDRASARADCEARFSREAMLARLGRLITQVRGHA